MYPTKVQIEDKQYPINTDYRIALKCMDIINDDSISDRERTYAVIYKLFGVIPEPYEIETFIKKVELYLGCGEQQEEHVKRKKDMDFNHDYKYILSSFMSDYHIDLSKTDMHWYQFVDFIQGLTDKTILSRVREIRNYDLSEFKDIKTREKIIEAQKSVALKEKISEEEQSAIDEFEALF